MRVSHRPRAKAVQCSFEDWLDVAGVSSDRRDSDDHVEGLLEGEVVPDVARLLRGGE
jgi:hypothetical protein